jgi:hypothetical protein
MRPIVQRGHRWDLIVISLDLVDARRMERYLNGGEVADVDAAAAVAAVGRALADEIKNYPVPS